MHTLQKVCPHFNTQGSSITSQHIVQYIQVGGILQKTIGGVLEWSFEIGGSVFQNIPSISSPSTSGNKKK